ncbi:sulfurtransferase TusA family protein [Alkaliphilus sp. MSJ-5]|uniref:Sulfurtransferase TusA family protein n=1 Tax=Alkaliphilus flagellatus TaxID=2841507 RepID=A0ABS6G5I7_9FIRM|nr:sulfurtransferase TusA family protein [Alkaliphilus flagellatus]MBU5676982.1 sulfurtransferase TusA family protein [Alkaliphilus flagellatus]
MYKVVDARGRSCPEPVLMTKEAVSEYDGTPIEVLVDMMVAVENIKRFSKNQGFNVECSEDADGYSLIIKK